MAALTDTCGNTPCPGHMDRVAAIRLPKLMQKRLCGAVRGIGRPCGKTFFLQRQRKHLTHYVQCVNARGK